MSICRIFYIWGFKCSKSVLHLSTFAKKIKTKENKNYSVISFRITFIWFSKQYQSLSAFLNILFISFFRKSDSCLLKSQFLKALQEVIFSSISPWVIEPGSRVDIVSAPHYHFKIISHFSSLRTQI